MREAIDFYKRPHNWSNRLIAGDSLLVMNSLLEKEGMAGQVQMVYIGPPYGIKYGSNFQPFVNKREVKDGKDEDLTQEPEMIRAFRDTWELGDSFLSVLFARPPVGWPRICFKKAGRALSKSVLKMSISSGIVLDEVFGTDNFISIISFSLQPALNQRRCRVLAITSYGTQENVAS